MKRILNIRAFTLVELLVVVSIIAVLAALIFGVVGNVKKKANATKSVGNLRQIGIGMAALIADGVKGIDGGPGKFPSMHGVMNGVDYTWMDLVAEKLGIAEPEGGQYVWSVDPAKSVFQNPGKEMTNGADPSLRDLDVSSRSRKAETASYGYVHFLGQWGNDGGLGMSWLGPNKRTNLMLVPRPSQLAVVIETDADGKNDYTASHAYSEGGWAQTSEAINGGGNVLFADWHVAWLKRTGDHDGTEDFLHKSGAPSGLQWHRYHMDAKQGQDIGEPGAPR